jgi:hypothetical protein
MKTKQRFAILNRHKATIKAICPEVSNKSGIYLFYRTNEDNEKCFYVGQAKDLLQRTASHLMGRKQHIDKSLYVHKLYSEDNPYGWRLKIIYLCNEHSLDFFEQHFIKYYLDLGYKSYNVTGGGQADKKADVGERLQTKLKSYKNGKLWGYDRAKEEVRAFFDKYLDFVIKGKPNKIKVRKFEEFRKWMEVHNERETSNGEPKGTSE